MPVVVAANRDEFLARPTRFPGLLPDAPHAFGGLDVRGGGTWLAVNRTGMVAAILNRHTDEPPDATRRSRGELPLLALASPSAREAREWMHRRGQALSYNPYNLLVADREEAWIATNHGGKMQFMALSPGLHLLTNLDLDDFTCSRISGSWKQFASFTHIEPGSSAFRAATRTVLAKHDLPLDPRNPESSQSLCLHLDLYGTRSSTMVFLDEAGCWTYWHTAVAPCRSSHRRLSLPW